MAKEQLNIHGISTDLRDKNEIIEILDGMIEDGANRFKKAKTNATKRSEKSNMSFFGSVIKHLKGDNNTFQERVHQWVIKCFGHEVASDVPERNHRFIEEAIELVQSTGCTKEDVLMLVDYVYNRPVGHTPQEVGGVMVTLAALCKSVNCDMQGNGEYELDRVWKKIDAIRLKQQTKPKGSALPQ